MDGHGQRTKCRQGKKTDLNEKAGEGKLQEISKLQTVFRGF